MIPTTGLEGRLLLKKNPADYQTQRVRVKRDANAVSIVPEGDIINFKTMDGYRRTPVRVEDILQGIDSPEGYLFANLGVSAAVQLRYNGNDYAVVVAQPRKDIGDHPFKLISGYTPIETLHIPLDAILLEIAEEFVPITWDGKFVGSTFGGKPLPQPYAQVNAYEDAHPFEVTAGEHASYKRLALDPRTLLLNGKEIQGNPHIYYQVPVNGAQLVFPVSIQVDLDSLAGISHAETKRIMHLRHAEDKFDKDAGLLNAYLDPEPLCLMKLQDGRLTGEAYAFGNGELRAIDSKDFVLSEAFAPSVHQGLIPQKNISLKDYLAQK